MRSMVEGARSKAVSLSADAPSTAPRAVPLPRFAGQDEARQRVTQHDALRARHTKQDVL